MSEERKIMGKNYIAFCVIAGLVIIKAKKDMFLMSRQFYVFHPTRLILTLNKFPLTQEVLEKNCNILV
jgi:hypothetical protein